jgi:DNA-binding response OmpR family regulator
MTELDEPARILVVDDDPMEQRLLEVMLAPENVLVMAAGTGEEGLELALLAPPDLILLDVLLPGIDGFEVVARLKRQPATMNIPVILVTALTDREARMKGLNAGAEDFLSKPIDRAELCARVRNLLRLKAYGDFHERYGALIGRVAGPGVADLVASEQLYRAAFEATPLSLAMVDGDGRWIGVTRQLCERLGVSRAELLGPRHGARPLPTTKVWLDSADGAAPCSLWVFDVP